LIKPTPATEQATLTSICRSFRLLGFEHCVC